jgi:agmatinase
VELRYPATAGYTVLPVPYEGTVCYAKGTAAGPAAILAASQQIQWFDEELQLEFYRPGVATRPAVEAAADPAEQMARLRTAALEIFRSETFLLALGGEHSIIAPLVAACARARGPISVLQIDAHADLRDTYEGSKHSHACVMRRVLESTADLCQVGVRSYSREEYNACPKQIAAPIRPDAIESDPAWIECALEQLGPKVYVTLDMDGLDPSIAPGVGTPEPGGLSWRQVTGLLRRLCAEREVVAADVVETRPLGANHITECTAARLSGPPTAAAESSLSIRELPGLGRSLPADGRHGADKDLPA